MRISPKLKVWVHLTLLTFLLLVVVHIALPALFLLLNVSSFAIGRESFWLLRWENTSSQTGITFNMVPLLAIAAIVGLLGVLLQHFKRRLP